MPEKSDTPNALHARAPIAGNTHRISEAASLRKPDAFFDVHWAWSETAARRTRLANQPKRKLRASRQAFYDSI